MISVKSTTQELLDAIESHPGITAQELGKQFNFTRPNILYHIRILTRANKVYAKRENKAVPGTQGRPKITYHPVCVPTTLLDQVFHQLLLILQTENQLERLLQIAARSVQFEVHSNDPPVVRLNQLASKMTALGYQARWAIVRGGVQIQLHHCPFTAMRCSIPEICIYDKSLMEQAMGMEVRVINTRVRNEKIPCSFECKP